MVCYWEDGEYSWWEKDELEAHLAAKAQTDLQEPQPEENSVESAFEESAETVTKEPTAVENG